MIVTVDGKEFGVWDKAVKIYEGLLHKSFTDIVFGIWLTPTDIRKIWIFLQRRLSMELNRILTSMCPAMRGDRINRCLKEGKQRC